MPAKNDRKKNDNCNSDSYSRYTIARHSCHRVSPPRPRILEPEQIQFRIRRYRDAKESRLSHLGFFVRDWVRLWQSSVDQEVEGVVFGEDPVGMLPHRPAIGISKFGHII